MYVAARYRLEICLFEEIAADVVELVEDLAALAEELQPRVQFVGWPSRQLVAQEMAVIDRVSVLGILVGEVGVDPQVMQRRCLQAQLVAAHACIRIDRAGKGRMVEDEHDEV